MTYEPSISTIDAAASYIHLFNAMPGNCILLRTDAPRYTVVAATPAYSTLTGVRKEDLLGRGLFEVFPSNPNDPNDTGSKSLNASLAYVLEHKVSQELPVVRYDSELETGEFTERYWRSTNTPVLNEAGEVTFVIHSTEEITAQVKAGEMEQKLKGLELIHNLFMELPGVIGIVKGPENVLILANDSALKLWGKEKGDIIDRPLSVTIPELNGQGVFELFDNVRKTGLPYYANEVPITTMRTGTPEIRYFDLVYLPYYEEEGQPPAGVFTMSHDVTETVLAKQKAEAAQKETERQKRLYEAVTGSTPDLIYVFDLEYRFTYANKALLDMWGKTWEDAIGKGLLDNGYEPWHAEMHEREIDEIVASKKPIRGEVAFPHATLGKRVYDYILVPVINEKGEVEAVAGTTRDITEIKLAEQEVRESNERFRNLADQSPMIVYIVEPNAEARMSYFNTAWLRYTGLKYEEALDRAWNGIVHPEDVQSVYDIYVPAFENRQPYTLPAVRLRRHDGVYRWHLFKGTPRYLPSGEFIGYIGVGIDIHEQKLAQEALKQSEGQLQQKVAERTAELERTVQELRRSNVNLEEFAYAASHDLKEPIRKIHFFSDRIKERMGEQMTPEVSRYFERMEGASKRMGTLIDDLLSYSQVSIRPRIIEEVNLNQLIDQVLEDLDLEIEDKDAVVTVDKLFTIRGHQRQLQQAFQNLIGNALKYSKPGEVPQVNISYRKVVGKETGLHLSPEEQEKEFYCITIRDNGIGFEQTDAERIFNVFTRLHGMAEYKGTGIGLSIVRKVIENHNGYIWATSQLGHGSSFYILLPGEM